VLETLRAADIIYCEDTRVTRKLTARYEISAPLRRADAHKLPEALKVILADLEEGRRLAYVSDAGMPGISDPGGLLVSAVREAGFPLEVLPGASALTTALAASGIKAKSHYFGGYFPRKSGAGTRLLEETARLEDTVLVFYESIHRVTRTLRLIASVLPDRQVTMARELTKFHEELLTNTAAELAQTLEDRIAQGRPLKGEAVLLIAPLLQSKLDLT
jgi:16S rRNA (cytidine1402-2'-O)-methyltransferase